MSLGKIWLANHVASPSPVKLCLPQYSLVSEEQSVEIIFLILALRSQGILETSNDIGNLNKWCYTCENVMND